MIGPVRIDCPVVLAPMTGVTDMPFRTLVRRYGSGLNVTEMIASEAMIRETRQSLQKCEWNSIEEPVSMQLVGCDPQSMAEAAKLNEDRGAAIIDINFGCPVRKVVGQYAGSALMREVPLATKLMEATVKAVSVPVTVKMRMGWDHASLNAPELAHIAEDLGVKHDHRPRPHAQPDVQGRGRLGLRAQGQGRGVDPGDRQRRHLRDRGQREALEQSGADGLMIGRGAYGKPWLLGQVMHWWRTGDEPGRSRDRRAVSRFLSSTTSACSRTLRRREAGTKIARKHLGWYTKGLHGSAEFRNRANFIDDPVQVLGEIERFYEPFLRRRAA